MQAVEDKMETIHLYVVREQLKQPYTLLPLLCALLCLSAIAAVTLYSAQHPSYEHQRLTVPAVALPPRTFTARVPIIPTGIKTYPAADAHGTLTISNGSVASQTFPSGLVFMSKSGVQVVTDQAVFVPAGSADGFGITTVPAHAMIYGKKGNILIREIDYVEGVNIYVRNLTPFIGGKDSYSVSYATIQDKQTAFITARNLLATATHDGLHYPCKEMWSGNFRTIAVTWRCQFVKYTVPAYMHVTAAHLFGKNFLINVVFIPRSQRI